MKQMPPHSTSLAQQILQTAHSGSREKMHSPRRAPLALGPCCAALPSLLTCLGAQLQRAGLTLIFQGSSFKQIGCQESIS